MNILIYMGYTQYDVFKYYAAGLKDAFENMGHAVEILDLKNDDNINQTISNTFSNSTYELVIGYNGGGCDIKVGNDSLYNVINSTFLGFFVDHPIYHISRLAEPVKEYIATFLDESHVDYIDKLMPNHHMMKAFLPPSSNSTEAFFKDFDEYKNTKEIDILFTGTYLGLPKKPWENNALAPKEIYETIADELINNEYSTLQEATQKAFKNLNLKLSYNLFLKNAMTMCDIMTYARMVRRTNIITKLCESGKNIVVYGKNWQELSNKYSNLNYLGEGSSEKTIEVSRKARIVINVNTNFTHGAHERVFTAIQSGAVLFTDRSKYYEKRFEDEKEILYYSLNSIDDDINKLLKYIDNEKALYEMAKKAYEIMLENDTWKHRAQTIIDLYNYKQLLQKA